MKKLKEISPVIFVILTFIVIVITQFIFFSLKDSNQISKLNSQIENQNEKELFMEETIHLMNQNLNEVRNMLSLPELDI